MCIAFTLFLANITERIGEEVWSCSTCVRYYQNPGFFCFFYIFALLLFAMPPLTWHCVATLLSVSPWCGPRVLWLALT